MLQPELSGESKHRRNLDTQCPKVSRVCADAIKDNIQWYPKIKHADWMIFFRHRSTNYYILATQVLRHTIPVCAESRRHTRTVTQAKDTEVYISHTRVSICDLKNKTHKQRSLKYTFICSHVHAFVHLLHLHTVKNG